MSWRRSKYQNKYNRQEDREEGQYWLDICLGADEDWWYDDDYEDWYVDGYPGYVANMDEYHTIHILTLLRKLNIRTATSEANDRGW